MKLLNVLRGDVGDSPPIWIMRQAGRYLPEYRALREQAEDFISFCLTPDLAAEATLQPLRRYPLDAAIVFADILLIPHVLGQHVQFVEGEGPVMKPLRAMADVRELHWGDAASALSPVYETLRRVRAQLPGSVALIGFAGAPWTVATYMLSGGGGRFAASVAAWRDQEMVRELVDLLAIETADYLVSQAQAGAEVLKIFDSWAGVLPPSLFERFCIVPAAEIVRRVRSAGVTAPIMGFPRGAGALVSAYAAASGVDAIALDHNQASAEVLTLLRHDMPLQGGLDPAALVAGGPALLGEVSRLKSMFAGRPYVFNLAHGIVPETPPENVSLLIDAIRG